MGKKTVTSPYYPSCCYLKVLLILYIIIIDSKQVCQCMCIYIASKTIMLEKEKKNPLTGSCIRNGNNSILFALKRETGIGHLFFPLVNTEEAQISGKNNQNYLCKMRTAVHKYMVNCPILIRHC